MSEKLNVLLAKTDSLASLFKGMVSDFSKFFSNSQGAFTGEKKTYSPVDESVDDPSLRGNRIVASTIDEKFSWFTEHSQDYISALFSQEKTNASGSAIAELIIDGKSWGTYTSLELLRLKSIIDHQSIYSMLSNVPTRSDSAIWNETTSERYAGRAILETEIVTGVNKTTEKESYILKDPNIDASSPSYTPTVANKTTTVTLGNFTRQEYSGAWSHRQKAEALARRSKMTTSILEALKRCNEVETVQSNLTADKIFGYLFNG